MKSGSKTGFKWKHMEELIEELIGGLDILDYNARIVTFKGLDMLEYASHAEARRMCIVW